MPQIYMPQIYMPQIYMPQIYMPEWQTRCGKRECRSDDRDHRFAAILATDA